MMICVNVMTNSELFYILHGFYIAKRVHFRHENVAMYQMSNNLRNLCGGIDGCRMSNNTTPLVYVILHYLHTTYIPEYLLHLLHTGTKTVVILHETVVILHGFYTDSTRILH